MLKWDPYLSTYHCNNGSKVVSKSDDETGPTQAIFSSPHTTSNASKVTNVKYCQNTKMQMQFVLGNAYEH